MVGVGGSGIQGTWMYKKGQQHGLGFRAWEDVQG